MAQAISNVVLYLDDGNAATSLLKVKLQPTGYQLYDIDDLHVGQFLQEHAADLHGNVMLKGISVHAGQEYPNLAGTDGTAQGEGAFYFLLDDDAPQVVPIGSRTTGSWTFNWQNDDYPLSAQAQEAGFTNALLSSQAQVVYDSFDPGTGSWSV